MVMPPFTSEHAREVLGTACQAVGFDAAGAELLQLGSKAVFRLAGPARSVVVRVARAATQLPVAERELCVARWLDGKDRGVPSARVHEDVPDQPLVVAGHPVTFWQAVDPGAAPPTVADLGLLLRRLHTLTGSPCDLPRLDPLTEIRSCLGSGLAIPAADRDFVRTRCEQLDSVIPNLESTLPTGLIHGDAHPGNLLGGHGNAVLNDFEMCVLGPREWDLVPLVVAHVRLGLPARSWQEFVDAYGFDVRSWSGFPVLREACELFMTVSLAKYIGKSPAVASEVAIRLASLRDGDSDRAWTAGPLLGSGISRP